MINVTSFLAGSLSIVIFGASMSRSEVARFPPTHTAALTASVQPAPTLPLVQADFFLGLFCCLLRNPRREFLIWMESADAI